MTRLRLRLRFRSSRRSFSGWGIFVISLALTALFVSLSYANVHTVHIGVTPEIVKQGNTFVVKVFSEKPLKSVSARIFNRTTNLFPFSYKWRGIIGVPVNAGPGKYKLKLFLNYKDGTQDEFLRYVTVKKKYFEKRSFTLKPKKMALLSPEILEEDWVKIEKHLIRERKKPLWKERFIIPTKGIVTMPFGAIQYINGKESNQHNGVDFNNKPWTKIRSANAGQVVLAEELKAHGNTVIIDHGNGVLTMYLHLARINVVKNEIVWKGKVIGYMGSTGVATGTHLHWGMSVHNVRVDPMEWAYRTVAK